MPGSSSSPEPAEVELLRDPREHVGQLRVGAQVGEQAVTHPAANLLTVDHHEADGLARRHAARASRSHSGPPPGSARMSHSIPGCCALKSS